MLARIEIEADPASIDLITDQFEPEERPSETELVLEEEMTEVIEVVQLQEIPTDAWEIEPEIES